MAKKTPAVYKRPDALEAVHRTADAREEEVAKADGLPENGEIEDEVETATEVAALPSSVEGRQAVAVEVVVAVGSGDRVRQTAAQRGQVEAGGGQGQRAAWRDP